MPRLTIHQRGSLLKDAVFSASDGIITTFAIVTGAIGASLPANVIVILGFANLFADGISMAAGNYLGSKTEEDYEKAKGDRNREGSAIIHALVTIVSFCAAGMVPLLPYVLQWEPALQISIFLVICTQFSIGSLRSLLTQRSFLKGGLEMLGVGGFAASVAYGIGYFLQGIIH